MRSLIPPEYLDFQLEENIEGHIFTTYGPSHLHSSYHEELKKFINERYFEEFNSFEFKEPLIWHEFSKEFINKIFVGAHESSSALNLTENLTIYIRREKLKDERPVLFFACYRRFKSEVYRFLEAKIKDYEKKLMANTVLISKELFSDLRRFVNRNEEIGGENENVNQMAAQFSFENIEKKAQVKINFNMNEIFASNIYSAKFRGCFEISGKNKLQIALYQGFASSFPAKTINIYAVDWSKGEIFNDFFPIIKKEDHENFMKQFENSPKQRFYHIKTKGIKKLKNKSIPQKRIFLCPVQNMKSSDTFIDFFEEFNIENALFEVFEGLCQEDKPLETVNFYSCDTLNEYSEDLTGQILNFIRKINVDKDFKIKTLSFFDTSVERTEKLYQGLINMEINEKNRQKIKENNDFQWFFIDESLQEDWQEFPKEINKEIETGFRIYQKNRKKALYYHFEEGDSQDFHVKIRMDTRNTDILKVFIEEFKQCLDVASFFKEIDMKEFGFVKKEKIIQNFKDLDQDFFWFYASFSQKEGKTLSKLRNNTCVSLIDFNENNFIEKNQRKSIKRKLLIKRGSTITRIENRTKNPEISQEIIKIREKIDFEGDRVKLYIKGFEDNIKHAKLEIEKVAVNNCKKKGLMAIPLEWEAFINPLDYLIIYELGKSAKYQEIRQKIEKTVKNKEIYRIERVQNRDLYSKFYEEMQILTKKRDQDTGVNVKYLFFGSQNNLEKVCNDRSESFDPKEEKNEVLMFHQEACEALAQASENQKKQKVIVLAEVLVGKSFIVKQGSIWNEKEKRPPLEGSVRLDSVEEKGDNGEIVRIFDKNRAYPEFLITFQE